MIRYALACGAGHEFESWFPSASSFDAQAERGLVQCPVCGSPKVAKTIMAPSVGRKGNTTPAAAPSPPAAPGGGDAPPAPAGPSVPAPVAPAAAAAMALLSEKEQAVRAMLRAVRRHVTETSDYVGRGFADEARRMHYGETPHRSIYGEAAPAEAEALAEEGIAVQALPPLPDDHN